MRFPILSTLTLACLPLLASVPIYAAEQETPITQDQRDNPRLTDELFVTKAGQANLAEVQLSRKALEKSDSEAVKEFAQHIIQDHQQAHADLKRVAGELGLDVPTEMGLKQQTALSKLDAVEGGWFNEEYAEHMISGHRSAVALFEQAAQGKTLSPELQRFAGELLPKLRRHEEEAKALKEEID